MSYLKQIQIIMLSQDLPEVMKLHQQILQMQNAIIQLMNTAVQILQQIFLEMLKMNIGMIHLLRFLILKKRFIIE